MVRKAPTLVSYNFVTGWVKPNYADGGVYVIAHKAWKFLKNCARCVPYVSIIFLKFMKLQFSGPYPHPCISPDEMWLVRADLWSHARCYLIAATCPLHGEKPKITLCVNEILAVCHMASPAINKLGTYFIVTVLTELFCSKRHNKCKFSALNASFFVFFFVFIFLLFV